MTEKMCSQGHVISAGRERCDRCNGLPVQVPAAPQEAPVEVPKEQEAAASSEPSNAGQVSAPEAPATPTTADTQPAPTAPDAQPLPTAPDTQAAPTSAQPENAPGMTSSPDAQLNPPEVPASGSPQA